MHTRRRESTSELSPAHRWQLSHWPSLQSFLLLRFAARKIPHPVGVGNAATAHGCVGTKNKGEIVVRAVAAGSGPACQDLADSIPGSCKQSLGQHCLPTAPLVCQAQHCKVCDEFYLPAWAHARATSKQPLLSHLIPSPCFLARSTSHLALPGLP